ncbi:uncharacterized protein LOC129292791 [Prosopis cineraria]|uniref:uncharacterized protein LOC129292791 n=1 Tax=Prosopis cineraria TaxID=364024 RepID=UPI00240F66D2|nr:uncharacterized protein LOC129292791 [Prosopis cineraria]
MASLLRPMMQTEKLRGTIWRWWIPDKIKTFMWLLDQNKLHTTEPRNRMGIAESGACPFGHDAMESSLHVVRDCNLAKERCTVCRLLNLIDQLADFSNTGCLNSRTKPGKPFTNNKLRWAVLFASMCWELLTTVCKKLFR